VRFGRPKKPLPANFAQLVRRWEQGGIEMDEVLATCDMSESTFFRRLRALRSLSTDY
jgi:hypothetical protein